MIAKTAYNVWAIVKFDDGGLPQNATIFAVNACNEG